MTNPESPVPSPEPREQSDWRLSWRKRAEAAAIAGAGYPLISALGQTLRWRVDGWQHLEAIWASGRQPVMAFWHGRILPATFYFRNRGIVVITSENFDGEWIARIIERFGYGTSRGSTSRRAKRAMLQLVRDMRRGKAAGFTVDGPRGPARIVQPGAVWLAGATGNPVLPFHLEASSHWTMRSWDRTQIPKPFSTVALAIGEPLEVPTGWNVADLELARQLLQNRLMALERRSLEMLGRSSPDIVISRAATGSSPSGVTVPAPVAIHPTLIPEEVIFDERPEAEPVFGETDRTAMAANPLLAPVAHITPAQVYGLLVALGEYAMRGAPLPSKEERWTVAMLEAHDAMMLFRGSGYPWTRAKGTELSDGDLVFNELQRMRVSLHKYAKGTEEVLTRARLRELLETLALYARDAPDFEMEKQPPVFESLARSRHAHNALLAFMERPFTVREFCRSLDNALEDRGPVLARGVARTETDRI